MPSPQTGSEIAQFYSTKTPGEVELEKQLGLMTAAIADCFATMGKEDQTMFRDQRRQESSIAADLLRLSVGLEDVDELHFDLTRALSMAV